MKKEPWIAENIIVTLDFDGCIAIGDHLKVKYAKLIHNVDIDKIHSTRETYPLGPTKYLELMDIVGSEYILEYNLDPQCKQVLNDLFNQGFRFAIVTSRERKLLDACKKFIKYHNLPIKYFHGTGKRPNKITGEPEYMPKDFFVNELKSRAMIDDTLYKLAQLNGAPAQLFFLVRPWSKSELKDLTGELKKRINVIKDWREFSQNLIYMRTMHEAICYYNNWKNDWITSKDIFNFYWSNPKLCEDYLKKYSIERAA
jgi:hypothetical protein